MKQLLLFVCCVFAAVGCGEKSLGGGAAGPASTEPAWTPVKAGAISMSIPKTIEPVDLTPNQIADSLDRLAKELPQFAEVSQVVRNLPPGVRFTFIGVDRESAKTGFASNVNIVEEDVPADTSFKELADANAAGLEQMVGPQKLVRSQVKLPAGDAERREFEAPAADGKKAQVLAYLFLRGTTSYNVTFTIAKGHSLPVEKIMDTLRLD